MYTNNVHKFDNNDRKENDFLGRVLAKEIIFTSSLIPCYITDIQNSKHAQLTFDYQLTFVL